MKPVVQSANAIKNIAKFVLLTGTAGIFVLLNGCASNPQGNPKDPFETLNRKTTVFNEDVDRLVLKPVATAYKMHTPAPVRTGVSNFFANLTDVWSTVNNGLQLKPAAALDSLTRVGINTFFGVVGVFDVAGDLGIERHTEDFGQTLGRWGIPSGPYLVLPILGPSTLRDSFAYGIETRADIVRNLDSVPERNVLYTLRAVETRANLLRASQVLDEAALDKYSFSRDAFLQRRRNDIYDGNAPEEEAPEPPAGK